MGRQKMPRLKPNRLAEIQDRAGISNRHLAYIARCGESYIRDLRAQRCRPNDTLALRIAEALRVEPRVLWPDPLARGEEGCHEA